MLKKNREPYVVSRVSASNLRAILPAQDRDGWPLGHSLDDSSATLFIFRKLRGQCVR